MKFESPVRTASRQRRRTPSEYSSSSSFSSAQHHRHDARLSRQTLMSGAYGLSAMSYTPTMLDPHSDPPKHKNGPQRRPSAPTTENALGLTNITALATPDGMTASSYKSEHLPPQYAPPSDGTSSIAASGAQFGPFGTHAPAFQTPAADFGFYVQQQDQLPSQNTLMIPNLMQPGTDHLAHRPIYMLGGEYCSPSYVAYDNRMDSYPVAYTSYQHPSLPLFQHTPLTYNPTAMQQSRPVTSSSSGSPDEALMTPLLNNDPQHSDSHLLCVSTMPLESPFSTSPSTGGLAHGLEGMSCMPQAISGAFTSAQQSASMSSLRPPPLPRRNTDDLPFTDSPLSRSAPSRQKPYDVKSHSTQRPSSMDFQSSVHPTAVLSLDSNFLGKQRIACQGCREKKLKCTGTRPVCYNCAKKGRSTCHYVTEIKRRGPGKKRLEAEARAGANGYFTDNNASIPPQYAFWAGQNQGHGQ